MKQKLILLSLLIATGVVLFGALRTSKSKEGGESAEVSTSNAHLRSAELTPLPESLRGIVVFGRPDGIYTVQLPAGTVTPLSVAPLSVAPLLLKSPTQTGSDKDAPRYPRWSPDGRHIAAIRGREVIRISYPEGEVKVLATATEPKAVSYRGDGQMIYFIEGKVITGISPSDDTQRPILDTRKLAELDVTSDELTVLGSLRRFPGDGWRIYRFSLPAAQDEQLAGGCGPSLSPDETLSTNLLNGHTAIDIFDWRTGERRGQLTAPAGIKFDNPAWSNHMEWIVTQSEGTQPGSGADVLLHHLPSNTTSRVTELGDCERPDLFVQQN